jgi:hypothetical protein
VKIPATTATVRVDPARRADHPLSKSKFAVFNSGIVHAATYRRDEAALRAARPESVRIDIGWGAAWIGYQRPISTPVPGGFVYDFSELDEIGSFLNGLGIRPYWSYCYVPAPYQSESGDWRDLAKDDSGWVEMIRAYVEGARERGVHVGYHEVYNEPDLRDEKTGEAVFFGGDLEDYLQLYRATATAIREADPGTPVGGPALASVMANEHWIPAFLLLPPLRHPQREGRPGQGAGAPGRAPRPRRGGGAPQRVQLLPRRLSARRHPRTATTWQRPCSPTSPPSWPRPA